MGWGVGPIAQTSASTMGNSGFGGAAEMTARAGGEVPAPNGQMSPAMLALSVVDDTFKQQIELLRTAAARHRDLLEKAHGPLEERPATIASASPSDSPAVAVGGA